MSLTTEQVKTAYQEWSDRYMDLDGETWFYAGRRFDTWLNEQLADAWDKGHRKRQRKGPDKCTCDAWNRSECACGKYGTGKLLSLKDNPYRKDEGDGEKD